MQKMFDVLCFVAGPTLFAVGVFNFSFREAVGDNSVAVAYLYEREALTCIAVGIALVALGILRKSWARETCSHA